MEWTQLKVNGRLEDMETICAVMMMLDSQIMIEDYSDIDMDTVYADLIDESILNCDKSKIAVSIYVPEDKSIAEYASFLRDRFRALAISCDIEFVGVDEEAWSTAWRKYYHPTKIGQRLVVVPLWEADSYQAQDGEIVLYMDPGMAFGTGTHETTRLCATLLEKYVKPGDRMLDVGTGSGILAICGSLLGISEGEAYDIDPVAVRVAAENMAENHVTNVMCGVSDLLRDVPKGEDKRFHICTANIVADIIIRMAPEIGAYLMPHAVYITSGIINERADEVRRAMVEQGYTVLEEVRDNGWTAFAFTPAA
ncbi:MAG: 50S ribosomal protein L11 methyltransferase [Clostridia bacterium]|nr:50S ribosomal protein L11 methyltransferase [Clostridia bacterium]